MIVEEVYAKRADDVVLVKNYSDAGYYIKNEDDVVYEYAIDPQGHSHTYTETEDKIEYNLDERVTTLEATKQKKITVMVDVPCTTWESQQDDDYPWVGLITIPTLTSVDYCDVTFASKDISSMASYCESTDGILKVFSKNSNNIVIKTITITEDE